MSAVSLIFMALYKWRMGCLWRSLLETFNAQSTLQVCIHLFTPTHWWQWLPLHGNPVSKMHQLITWTCISVITTRWWTTEIIFGKIWGEHCVFILAWILPKKKLTPLPQMTTRGQSRCFCLSSGSASYFVKVTLHVTKCCHIPIDTALSPCSLSTLSTH